MIGLYRSGRCFPTLFACAHVRFRPSGYSSTVPMSFLHECLLRKSCTPWSSLLLPPFLQKGRMGVDGLGMPLCCFPRVFLSSCSTLVEREGWRILWSRVCCTDACFCLLGSFMDGGFRSCSLAADSCYLFCSGWLSSSTLHARRGVGEGESSVGVLCSRLPLPPHLCTLGEVVGRVSRPSADPVRVLPGLPILGLGSRVGV